MGQPKTRMEELMEKIDQMFDAFGEKVTFPVDEQEIQRESATESLSNEELALFRRTQAIELSMQMSKDLDNDYDILRRAEKIERFLRTGSRI